MTLYNYGERGPEEYQLMKLFEMVLIQEVAQLNAIGKMVDVLNGNPLVVKMIISYARRVSPSVSFSASSSSLRDAAESIDKIPTCQNRP